MIGAWQKKARGHMAKPKKGQTIIIRSPDMINQRFYEGFDHKFLYRKAQTLMFLVKEQERFTQMVMQAGEAHEDGTELPLLREDIDDKYFERLRAEVYFCEMHQFEGFFALLLAVFQGIPHWLYLTLYETKEIKQAVEHYLAGNITAVTNGALSTVEDFITRTVYAGFSPEARLGNSQWDESIECIDWMLKHESPEHMRTIFINKDELHALRKFFTLSLTV